MSFFEKTKQKAANFGSNVKRKAADCGSKIKQKAVKYGNDVKEKAKRYGGDIKNAYELGYNAGWRDCPENSPIGATISGAVGYGCGYRAKKKYNKAQRSETYVRRIQSRIDT